jgi:predicted nucleotidyltransferase
MGIAAPLSAHDRELIAGIVVAQREENARVERACIARLEAARTEARRLAALLSGLPGVARILLFGSSATGFNFRLDSDIDLALQGGDVLEAMATAETSAFKVDIIDLEGSSSLFRRRIEKEGLVLYEKDQG